VKRRLRLRALLQAVAPPRVEEDDVARSGGQRGVVDHGHQRVAVRVRRVLPALALQSAPCPRPPQLTTGAGGDR
jgi:hypothetical protein